MNTFTFNIGRFALIQIEFSHLINDNCMILHLVFKYLTITNYLFHIFLYFFN